MIFYDSFRFVIKIFAIEVDISSSASLQASHLLSKVVRVAARTLVRWREHRHLLDGVLAIDVVAHARQGVTVNVVEVVL